MSARKDFLVGQLAVEREFITAGQFEDALQNQKALIEMGMQQDLLQVLVSKGHLKQAQADELKAAVEGPSQQPTDTHKRVKGPSRPPAVTRKRVREDTGARARVRGTGRERLVTDRHAEVRRERAEEVPIPLKKSNVGLIVGIVGGGLLMLFLIVVAVGIMIGSPEPDDKRRKRPASVTGMPAPGAPGEVNASPEAGDAAVPVSPKELVPAGDAAKNVLPNGSLDEVSGFGFRHWRVRNGGIRATKGIDNSWCEFPEGGGYLEQELVLQPEWTKLRVSAVMACEGLEFGEGPDDTFRVAIQFRDAAGNNLGSPAQVPELIEDTDWVDVSVEVSIPTDRSVHSMVLRLGNFGAGGDCKIDEIRVIPEKIVLPLDLTAGRAASSGRRRRPDHAAPRGPSSEPAKDEEPAAVVGGREDEGPGPAPTGDVFERNARLAEFRELLMRGDHVPALDLAKRSAKEAALAPYAAHFRAAARVAQAFEERRIYIQGAVRVMAGRAMELQTVNGPLKGKILGADELGVNLGKDIVINRKIVGQRSFNVPWSDLTRQQIDDFAADWKPDNADGQIALAILAAGLEEQDVETVANAVEAAGDHLLVDWVIGLIGE